MLPGKTALTGLSSPFGFTEFTSLVSIRCLAVTVLPIGGERLRLMLVSLTSSSLKTNASASSDEHEKTWSQLYIVCRRVTSN